MTTQPRFSPRPGARCRWASLALGASVLAAPAQMDAFDPPPDAPERQPAHAPADDVLRGPDVEPDAAPGRRGAFGAEDRPGASGIQLMAVLREARQLRGPDVPESARITREQTQELMGIARAYQQDRQAFMRSHQAEFDELRAVLGELAPERTDRRGQDARDGEDRPRARAQRTRSAQQGDDADAPARERPQRADRPQRDDRPEGDRPAPEDRPRARQQSDRAPRPDRADRPKPTPEQAEALKQWRELMSKGPEPKVALAQVMDVLTPEQRELVGERLERRMRDAERGQEQRTGREQRRRAEPRPAPGIDSVDVPRPTDG